MKNPRGFHIREEPFSYLFPLRDQEMVGTEMDGLTLNSISYRPEDVIITNASGDAVKLASISRIVSVSNRILFVYQPCFIKEFICHLNAFRIGMCLNHILVNVEELTYPWPQLIYKDSNGEILLVLKCGHFFSHLRGKIFF